MDRPDERWTLTELAERSGVPGRTLRYYISRGLMDGPAQAGRSAYYNRKHLTRIEQIRKLQQEGLMLAQIASKVTATEQRVRHLEFETWMQYDIHPEVRVMVKEGLSPWKVRLIRDSILELANRLRMQSSDERSSEDD